MRVIKTIKEVYRYEPEEPAIATLEMIRGGFLIPTAKLRIIDLECEGMAHVRTLEERTISRAMKCSFGFGGANGAVVLGAENARTEE